MDRIPSQHQYANGTPTPIPVYIKSETSSSFGYATPVSYGQPADQGRRVQTSSRLSQQIGNKLPGHDGGYLSPSSALSGSMSTQTHVGPPVVLQNSQGNPVQRPSAPVQTIAVQSSQGSGSGVSGVTIDPKYVGELEAALGKLRVENAYLQENNAGLQRQNTAITNENVNLTNRIQEVNKVLEENNNLKLEKSRLSEELDSKNRETQATSEKNKQLLEQLFAASYDKFAFDATIKDNANLREHIRSMEQLLQNLQETFENYKRETYHLHEDNKNKSLQLAQLDLGMQQLTGNVGSLTRQFTEGQQEQTRLLGLLRQKEDMVKLLQQELAQSVASVQKLQYVVAHGNAPSN